MLGRDVLDRKGLVLVIAAAALGGCGDDSGGAAGTSGGCLDASLHGALFSVSDPALCAVAVYTADVTLGYTAAPTWGRHGGPLLVAPGEQGAVTLKRLNPPAGATGALTSVDTTVDAGIPEGAFLGVQAVDLPFFDWTVISWSGAFPDTAGEVIAVGEAGAVSARYGVNGLFAAGGLSAAGEAGRLVHTGLSAVDDVAQGASGLYAADSCGTPDEMPRLTPDGDPTCAAPALVAAWGDFSGPLASDADGNVFVVMPSLAGDQEARGFSAASAARGAGATMGSPLFTLPGGGASLAALAPDAGGSGLLVFQATDATSFDPLDPLALPYAAEAGAVVGQGAPAPLLELTTEGTLLSLMVDDANRLWVGGASGSATMFVVLARP